MKIPYCTFAKKGNKGNSYLIQKTESQLAQDLVLR
jgi:hypothetical protein